MSTIEPNLLADQGCPPDFSLRYGLDGHELVLWVGGDPQVYFRSDENAAGVALAILAWLSERSRLPAAAIDLAAERDSLRVSLSAEREGYTRRVEDVARLEVARDRLEGTVARLLTERDDLAVRVKELELVVLTVGAAHGHMDFIAGRCAIEFIDVDSAYYVSISVDGAGNYGMRMFYHSTGWKKYPEPYILLHRSNLSATCRLVPLALAHLAPDSRGPIDDSNLQIGEPV